MTSTAVSNFGEISFEGPGGGEIRKPLYSSSVDGSLRCGDVRVRDVTKCNWG
jgi:hypothetical protein